MLAANPWEGLLAHFSAAPSVLQQCLWVLWEPQTGQPAASVSVGDQGGQEGEPSRLLHVFLHRPGAAFAGVAGCNAELIPVPGCLQLTSHQPGEQSSSPASQLSGLGIQDDAGCAGGRWGQVVKPAGLGGYFWPGSVPHSLPPSHLPRPRCSWGAGASAHPRAVCHRGGHQAQKMARSVGELPPAMQGPHWHLLFSEHRCSPCCPSPPGEDLCAGWLQLWAGTGRAAGLQEGGCAERAASSPVCHGTARSHPEQQGYGRSISHGSMSAPSLAASWLLCRSWHAGPAFT